MGDDGFKKAPIGAGPYRFVSFQPGIELVLEAYEQYWRKTPSVKRLVFKSVPDESTRLATSTNLALMGARFDFANQELRIARMKAADLQRNIAFEREQLRTERFIREGLEFRLDVVRSAAEVIPAFEYRLKTTPDKVPAEPLLNKM